MAGTQVFRADHPRAKWHLVREAYQGVLSKCVYVALCGTAMGDDPERGPRGVFRAKVPSGEKDRVCKTCTRKQERAKESAAK